jgi:hypothetical protein
MARPDMSAIFSALCESKCEYSEPGWPRSGLPARAGLPGGRPDADAAGERGGRGPLPVPGVAPAFVKCACPRPDEGTGSGAGLAVRGGIGMGC